MKKKYIKPDTDIIIMEGIQLLAGSPGSNQKEEGTAPVATGQETTASNDPYSTYTGLAKGHNLWDDGEENADPWK
jgi:hypothetical protein